MNKWLELLLGIIFVLAPLFVALAWKGWGQAVIDFIQGGLIIGFILVGLLLIVLGISDFKG